MILRLLFLAAIAWASCNDTQDLTAFKTDHASFHKTMQNCATENLGSTQRTADCIQKAVGLTPSCALCFGQDANCVSHKCLGPCAASPSGSSCSACVKKDCYPGLLNCSQVPSSSLPP